MRTLSLLALLIIPATASAETSLDKHLGAVDAVEIGGVVEVPLLSTVDAPLVPTVSARINGITDKPEALFAISSGDATITISDALVSRYGLEPKEKKDKYGGEFKIVELESIQIGDLLLRDVTALVSSSKVSGADDFADVQIGMGALPELAYAIVPSEGVVRFAPAASGAELLKQVGGTTVTYAVEEPTIVKVGEDKRRLPGSRVQAPVKVGGLEFTANLDTAATSTEVAQSTDRAALSAAIGAEATYNVGDVYYHYAPVVLSGAAPVEARVSSVTSPDRSAIGLHPRSIIGAEVLGRFDLAVDPATKTLALDLAEANKRVDALPTEIATARELARIADEKAAEAAREAGEGEGAADGPKPDAGAWTAVAQLHMKAGQLDEAITAWSYVVQADEASCSGWLGLGEAQLKAAKLDEAATSLGKASELYHSWWSDDIPVPDKGGKFEPAFEQVPHKNAKGQWIPALARAYWQEQADEGNKDELPEGLQPQPSSCWVADSQLAMAHLAAGRGDESLAIYERWVESFPPLRQVLDPTLAVVGGNVNLSRGLWDASHEQLRAAASHDFTKDDPRWALGLALAYGSQGRWERATELFRTALLRDPSDTMTVTLWLDGIEQQQGADAAWKAAQELAATYPDSPAAIYGLARAAKGVGDRSNMKARKAGKAFFESAIALTPRDATLRAGYARYLAAMGELDQAQETAEAALKLDPAQAAAYMALADVNAERGDQAKATAMLRRAGQAAPDHPGYALVLGKK